MTDSSIPPPLTAERGSAWEVLRAFLRLGCMSFGGPIAHLGYFHTEFVERRKWCDEESFGSLVGLAQSMPGPASSQVGFALGLLRAGWRGGIAAWVGFTMPSALLMLGFAFGHRLIVGRVGAGRGARTATGGRGRGGAGDSFDAEIAGARRVTDGDCAGGGGDRVLGVAGNEHGAGDCRWSAARADA